MCFIYISIYRFGFVCVCVFEVFLLFLCVRVCVCDVCVFLVFLLVLVVVLFGGVFVLLLLVWCASHMFVVCVFRCLLLLVFIFIFLFVKFVCTYFLKCFAVCVFCVFPFPQLFGWSQFVLYIFLEEPTAWGGYSVQTGNNTAHTPTTFFIVTCAQRKLLKT